MKSEGSYMADQATESKVQYRVRQGAHVYGDPDQVGAALDAIAIKHGGHAEPAHVVIEAKNKKSPLHEEFDRRNLWDDKKAAHTARLNCARELLRSFVVVKCVQGNEVEMPLFRHVSVQVEGGDVERGYFQTSMVLAKPEYRESLLAQALREAESWRRRYAHLEELAGVFESLDKIKK